MRTLALLAALLLLALQAQAGPLQERAEEAPKQEQPDTEDQDMAISFAGDESLGVRAAGERPQHCRAGACRFPESVSGSCLSSGEEYPLCCR
uniref:Mammalian defensins domain-containing protein n=1 Tax=Prolemur simus TaxID=1328070 RepID=A0A8C8ZDA2_PROSS